jgi:type II secretory ATPase GspE/PulE/Tfp pilus assembly ATPase PilB-like protein
MAMIRQTSVNEVVKLDFASGIRSMMRQDPDVILVGEVRDQETAEMAFRAAMTGHQVYSTLHTNSSIGAIPRLMDLGVLPDIMAGNIIGVIAQRLVRKLCAHCKTPYEPDEATRHLLGMEAADERPVFQPVGCARCDQVGYRGRIAIMEVFKLDAEIDELIARRATGREIRTIATARGFRSLADDAISRVLAGQTSLEEISRVVDLTDRVL